MSEKIVSKQELVGELAGRRGCTKREAGEILDDVFSMVAGYLTAGRDVRLTHIGCLNLRQYEGRVAYNPRNREEPIQVPARKRVKFSASAPLQKEVDKLPLT